MDIFNYPGQALPAERYAATIGFFDGVHRGHQYLLEQLRYDAARHGMKSLAVTFDRHPREVVQTGWQPQLLTTLDEKCALLAQTGIDALAVLRFDKDMATLTARQFMADVLHDHLHVHLLLTGYDNRFGHNRAETFADYERYGRELDIEVVCAQSLSLRVDAVFSPLHAKLGSFTPLHAKLGSFTPLHAKLGSFTNYMQSLEASPTNVVAPTSAGSHDQDEEVVSSSRIRRLLAGGDMVGASQCLGRHYSICGRVVHGEQQGHALGFPTANLMPCDPQKMIPANGAYAVVATLADGTRHHGMTNIGMRPTFHGERQTLETNIFDEVGDIYGQPLQIDFVARLRDEIPFSSPAALAYQLSQDRQQAHEILSAIEADGPNPITP